MKYLASVVVLLGVCGLYAGQGAGGSDLDKMQGVWLVVSLVEKGKPAPASDIDSLEVTIASNKFGVAEKGKPLVDYTIKIDSTKTPKVIDFTHQGGENKGRTEPGIYAFEKGQLKFIMDEDRKGRPTALEGKETLSYSVIVLKKKTVK